MPTKKKKRYNSRFPPARIKKIMQSDEEVGKVAAAVPVIISRALELFVETLLGNVNRAISDRGARTMTPSHLKMCIHSEPRFDFLKDLVAEVPELQGDTDEKEPQVFSDAASTAAAGGGGAASTSAADLSTKNGGRAQHRVQRQSSTSRPRGRPRKVSTEARSKPKASNRRFVEVESDESDSQVADMSDEEMASPLDGAGGSGGGASFLLTHSLPSSPLVLSTGESNPLSMTLEARAPFQRSVSYHVSSNGQQQQQQLVENGFCVTGGHVATSTSLFTMTIPSMALIPPSTSSTVSSSSNGKVPPPGVPATASAASKSNGLFSVSRLVDAAETSSHKSSEAKTTTTTSSAASSYQPMAASSYAVVDEDYDA